MDDPSEEMVNHWRIQVAETRRQLFSRILPSKRPVMPVKKGMSTQELSEFMKDYFGDCPVDTSSQEEKPESQAKKDKKGWYAKNHCGF